jgi:hypothetical protein
MAPPLAVQASGASFGDVRQLEGQIALFERGRALAAYDVQKRGGAKHVTLSHILPFGLHASHQQLFDIERRYEDDLTFSSSVPRLGIAMEFVNRDVADVYLAWVLLREVDCGDRRVIHSNAEHWPARRFFTQLAHYAAAHRLKDIPAPYVSLSKHAPRVFPKFCAGAQLPWFGAPNMPDRTASLLVHRVALHALGQQCSGLAPFSLEVMTNFSVSVNERVYATEERAA